MMRILILTEADHQSSLVHLSLSDYDAVILAFWVSPEYVTQVRQAGASECIRLNEIVDQYMDLAEQAFSLARYCVPFSPIYRGVNLFQVQEETVAMHLMRLLIAQRILRYITLNFKAGTQVCFCEPSPFQRAFEQLLQTGQFALDVIYPRSAHLNWARRYANKIATLFRLTRGVFKFNGLNNLLDELLEQFDRHYDLRRWSVTSARVQPGGLWFYSGYVNFTRILVRHIPFFNEQPCWVISRLIALAGLPRGAVRYCLWQFKPRAAFSKKRGEFQSTLETAFRDIRASVAPEIAELFHDQGPVLSCLRDGSSRVLDEVDLQVAFLDIAQPAKLVVANQWAGEGAIIQLAKSRNIPVIQAQHGEFGENYHFTPVYSDEFHVWGDFWKERVCASDRNKVRVINPGIEAGKVKKHSNPTRNRVTFFTAPLSVLPLSNVQVCLEEMVLLVDLLIQQSNRVSIRVHPADEIAIYQQAWKRLRGQVPETIHFDQSGALAQVLSQTDVAIVYHSTVFLDCLANKIPVIALGWYGSWWQEGLKLLGIVHFADSIEQVLALVKKVQASDGLTQDTHIERFLAPVSSHFAVDGS